MKELFETIEAHPATAIFVALFIYVIVETIFEKKK